MLGVEDFGFDSRAAGHRRVLEAKSDAFERLLEAKSDAFERLLRLLNNPANEQRLVDAEALGLPALAGVVRFIESDPGSTARRCVSGATSTSTPS